MKFDANEIVRAILIFGLLTFVIFVIANKVGRRRMFAPEFANDRAMYKLQKVTPYRGAIGYLFRSLAFYALTLALFAGVGWFLSWLIGIFSAWLLWILSAFYAWPLLMSSMNFTSARLFRHSELARRLAYAIQIDPKLPNMNFMAAQNSPTTVRVRYASPHPASIWKDRKKFLESAGNIDITEIREIQNGEIEFELAEARRLVVRAGEWIGRADGSLRLAKESSSYREVYFMYDRNFISDDGRRGRIKIGDGNTMDRNANGSTWVLNLEVLGYFRETPEFNEDSLHKKFERFRINQDSGKSGKDWFYDAPEIREFIDKKRLETV